ncbi:tRNA (adenosine(37)-N6)-dimethylallyltransferase MiaA [Scatolibacter rhodanostii]|uniref:tRNA (adenosine(37)-N6)-dimethylallyltransferase MiaA n=1 Tax=Scatolibacter rhodanostii TaxID=2014781 RepID=UPI000C07B8C7|nr:tRNA (adenosine(37)-N6)-dimethylallyltransferase MiaA [Scatolibacter rhodanostii]
MISAAAVVGPTASGKTAFAIQLAKRLNGEIISCDSMQIYKGLAVGTAKPSMKELFEVKHHLIDFLDIEKPFSVSDYVLTAETVMKDVWNRQKLPLIVGGTGLYARSLLSGLSFEEDCRDDNIRQQLTSQAETGGGQMLYEQLKAIDLAAANKIHPNNTKRVIRALEFCQVTGRLFSEQIENSKPATPKYNYLMFCLAFQDRENLYKRINQRVEAMIENGLLEEAKYLYGKVKAGAILPTVVQAIGYKELFPYFEGKVTLDEAANKIKQETRHYAKRQLTWFKREKNITYLYLDEIGMEQAIEEAVLLLEEKGIWKAK